MKIVWGILVGLAVLAAALGGWAFWNVHQLEVERVTEDLHVIYGMGGNVAVLRTDAGTVIVDTMTYEYQGARIRDLAAELAGAPVSHVINTHYHFDHTRGNPAFPPGTTVVSTGRTLAHLQQTEAEYFSGEAAALLPNQTFDDALILRIGGKTIELLHPGRGHTDGDLVAFMVEEGAVHLGDLFFHRRYPFIDLEAGGSVQAWGDSLDTVFALPFTKVIPGHGPVTDRAGLRQFQAFIRQLAEVGVRAKADGLSMEETQATDWLTEDEGYELIKFFGLALGMDRAFVLGRAWEETHNAFELRQ